MSVKNSVQLIGNLGSAPEITTLENGTKIAKFTLATNESYTNKKGEKVTDTQWHNIVAWNNVATIAENHLDKGSEVLVKGKLEYSSWDKEDGSKGYATNVVINEILMLGKKEA